jgi:hypothetical protein
VKGISGIGLPRFVYPVMHDHMRHLDPEEPKAGRGFAYGKILALALLLPLLSPPSRCVAAGISPTNPTASGSITTPAGAPITNQTGGPTTSQGSGNPKSVTWSLSARRIGLGIIQGPAQTQQEKARAADAQPERTQPGTATTRKATTPTTCLLLCQLVEQSTKEPLDCSHFQLCGSNGRCGESVDLGGVSNPIYIEMKDDFHPVGNYRGTVQVTGSAKEAQPFMLDIYGTTPWRKSLGVVAIMLGVALAWAISVFARSRIDRDQALLPAVVLRASLDKLLAVLEQVPQRWSGNVTATVASIRNLQDGLTEDSLDRQGLLPLAVPGPYPTTYSSLAYNQYLQAATEHANMLGVIVNKGMAQAWGMYKTGMTPAQMQAIAVALDALDALDAQISPPSQTQAQQQVDAILAKLRQALGMPAIAAAAVPTPPAAKAPTYQTLKFQIVKLTWAIWVALFVITVVTGYAALIQANAGFGMARDYLVCFLWGLGLPVGGLQLSALVPSSVSTALHVPIFK